MKFPVQEAKKALLLVNLGTPAAPTVKAVAAYLRQFLSDRRVVELPRWLWWPILYGVILPFRSPRSAHAYRSIWTEQGSPLLVYSQQLAEKLDKALRQQKKADRVYLAMRYGEPSVDSVVQQMMQDGVRELTVLPLYPQYSSTTTATVYDAVLAAFKRQRWLPTLRLISEYYRNEHWLDAVADSIKAYQVEHGRADLLLFSFHGLPKNSLQNGDPYYCQCQASARRIAERAGLSNDQYQVSFQSRVGRQEWLQPYTDETLKALPQQGVHSVQVVCPGFAVDCLETLEEIALQNNAFFQQAGGQALAYIPALNADARHVDALLNVVTENTEMAVASSTQIPQARIDQLKRQYFE